MTNRLEELYKIASDYDVKLKFVKNLEGDGETAWWINTVYIAWRALTYSRKELLSILFHELGHIYCYRNGIWKNYHHCKNQYSKEGLLKIRRIAIKAERWIDNWAEKELAQYDARCPYQAYYHDAEGKDFLKTYWKAR